ncbi:MAG TPA: response regulator [Stenomitos sp.]
MAIRLLLVEDHPVNARLLCRRLERHEYEVEVADNGETAIAMIQANPPNLVLMDIGLPGIDGWETTRQIRNNPVISAIPIIALTAHDGIEAKDHCLAAGCNDYAPKPVNFDQLLIKIQRWIESKT